MSGFQKALRIKSLRVAKVWRVLRMTWPLRASAQVSQNGVAVGSTPSTGDKRYEQSSMGRDGKGRGVGGPNQSGKSLKELVEE